VYQPRGQFKKAKVAFCIHNIAFQGRFWPESFKDMALPPAALAKLSFKDGYNKVRSMLHGLVLVLLASLHHQHSRKTALYLDSSLSSSPE
jgi:glycogen synthase